MKQNTWLNKGIRSLEEKKWFDGIQLIQGALQRSFRGNDYENVKKILNKTSELLTPAEKTNIFCQLVLSTILPIGERIKNEEWLTILHLIFRILVETKSNGCLSKIKIRIIETKYYHDNNVLEYLKKEISNKKQESKLRAELYYLLSSLQVSMQQYSECFETLTQWNSESLLSSEIFTYLTLAELNAFEIESCGQYLEEAKKANSQSEHTEFISQLFKAVELKDYGLYLSIIQDYRDLLRVEEDILLVKLVEGITDFMKPKDRKNLFSLFGGR